MSRKADRPVINDGHHIELIHTAYVAMEFFNEHVREHVLALHYEEVDQEVAAKFLAASDALYDVYNIVASRAPE